MFELKQTETFRIWRTRLKDERARALIASRLDRLAFGNAGDAKPVGSGISELRIDHGGDIESTFSRWERQSCCCYEAATKAHRQGIFRLQNIWQRNGETNVSKKVKSATKLTNYDPAEDLGSDEAIAVFMAEALRTNDVAYVAHALGIVARAKGMAQIASRTGLSREQLYRSFSANGNPTLKTTLAVMQALGITLTAKVPSAA